MSVITYHCPDPGKRSPRKPCKVTAFRSVPWRGIYCMWYFITTTDLGRQTYSRYLYLCNFLIRIVTIYFRVGRWSHPARYLYTLRWRHNGRDWVSNHQASPLFTQPFIQAQIKENIKAPRHWPLCGEFTGEFPAQMASNAENVSIWWRHHELDGHLTTAKHNATWTGGISKRHHMSS